MQVVEAELDAEETVIAVVGTINWIEEGIRFDVKMGDGFLNLIRGCL